MEQSLNSMTLLALLICAALFLVRHRRAKPDLPFPPGPKPIYGIGNIRDLTTKELWIRARQWAQDYGGVCYLHIFGQGLLFLNTPEAASDLMHKRGEIYSGKPQLVMLGELCGCKDMVPFVTYGDQSKRQRKHMNQALGITNIREYQSLIAIETGSFLNRLIDDPANYIRIVRRYAGGLTLFVIYGHQVKSMDDAFLTMAERCVWTLGNRIASTGGIWPVDIIPVLKYLPSWLPGMGFKRHAKIWKAQFEEYVEKPFEFTQNSIKKGNAMPSFCRTLLADGQESLTEQQLSDIKWTANSMYGASIDTTTTFIQHFILLMITHHDILVKAQAEIDSVVGSDRLPTLKDRESLPYAECLMSECLRWSAPVPLGLPHSLTEDDVYNGMFIPKGTLVVGNIWAITRNSSLYPNPDVFCPERFEKDGLDADTKRRMDPRQYVFGFGRRRCPGIHLFESSAWLLMVSMLATIEMSKATDASGNVIEPVVTFDDSVFRTPSAFKCSLKPRSARAAELIRQSH